MVNGFSVLLTNAGGTIYSATPLPGKLKTREDEGYSDNARYVFRDDLAKRGEGTRSGLSRVRIKVPSAGASSPTSSRSRPTAICRAPPKQG